LTYAVKTEKVTRNVAAMIDPPAYQPEKKTVLDQEQARRFIAALDGHPGEALFVLALLTQIREGELLALTWGDVDLPMRTVRISRTLQDDERGRPRIGDRPKTDAGERVVLLPKVAVRALQRHKPRSATDDALVFPSAAGKPLSRQNVLQRWLYPVLDECTCGHKPHAGRDTDATGARLEPAEANRRAPDAPKSCKACGCCQYRARLPKVTFHELRHSGATLLGDRHLAALQQRLGHSSSATTADIYLTLPVAAQKPLADRLDVLFGGTNEGTRTKKAPSSGKKKPRKT
jgi:integrase